MKYALVTICLVGTITSLGCSDRFVSKSQQSTNGTQGLPEPNEPQGPPEPNEPPGDPGSNDGGKTKSCAGLPEKSGKYEKVISHNSLDREAKVSIPETYDPEQPTPIVFNFHGATSTSNQQELLFDMDNLANSRGYITVHPQGIGNTWNAGTCCGDREVDDVDFFRSLVKELSQELCVDQERIYVTGLSNGGFLSYRLACEASDLVAAAAPVAGTIGIDDCNPTHRPIPILHLHGTNDILVSYRGGSMGPGAQEATDFFADINQCPAQSEILLQKDDWTCEQTKNCLLNSEVTLCTVDGGGHILPWNAKTRGEVVATEVILDFFDRNTPGN